MSITNAIIFQHANDRIELVGMSNLDRVFVHSTAPPSVASPASPMRFQPYTFDVQ